MLRTILDIITETEVRCLINLYASVMVKSVHF